MHTIQLDAGAAALLARLHAAGYAAYAVGGCVRDRLLGRPAHDWDLCTSARPEQVMALFGEEQCIPTGLQHGTVTIKQGGQLYETTTFRTEGSYTDGRHPDEVHFVPDVREDLARRDFTINAMAYNAEEGLIDPFGGQQDLAAGILRAVGDPRTRFEEDALRILRLYRFAARFGFAIDPPTGQAAEALCTHLDCVSLERIEEELAKLLSAPAPAAYLNEKILNVILPELSGPALQAAKPVVDACPAGSEDLPVRWAALLHSLGEGGTRRALKRLRCSNACIEETAVLVKESGAHPGGWAGSFSENDPAGGPLLPKAVGRAMEWPATAAPAACGGNRELLLGQRPARRECRSRHEADAGSRNPYLSEEKATGTPDCAAFRIYTRRLLGKYDLRTVQRLAALGTAMEPQRAAEFAAMAQLAEGMDADGVCCRVSQLAVNGRDLMAVGIPAGPGLRKMLEALLDAVIREQLPNQQQSLLDAAREISAS